VGRGKLRQIGGDEVAVEHRFRGRALKFGNGSHALSVADRDLAVTIARAAVSRPLRRRFAGMTGARPLEFAAIRRGDRHTFRENSANGGRFGMQRSWLGPSRWVLAVLGVLLVGIGAVQAQGYPNKKITIVVGFTAGGFADTLARYVGQKLSDKFGQAVVIENRGGAGGNTAASAVSKADADGYTLLVTTTAISINASLYQKLDYSLDQLAAIAMPGSSAETFAVPPDRPGTLKEFVAWAKGREITFATAGVGSGSHLAAEHFYRNLAKVKASHVPFRGGSLAMQAVLGGQVDAITASFGTNPHVQAGKLKGLAVASVKRNPVLPNVPTFAELGYPGFEAASWVGFFVPAKTDRAIVDKLNAAINEIVTAKANSDHLTKIGYTLTVRSTAESQKFLKDEVAKWGQWVKNVGLSVK
jgi:tripartite-type tricarboxylate transporter receptor subunit TctC